MAELPDGLYNLGTPIHELINMSIPIAHLIRSAAVVSGVLWSIASVSKGSQHVVLIVEATGAKPSVRLALMKDQPRTAASEGLSMATQFGAPQFVFYSAEITRLK